MPGTFISPTTALSIRTVIIPLGKGGNRDSERLSGLPEATQLVVLVARGAAIQSHI